MQFSKHPIDSAFDVAYFRSLGSCKAILRKGTRYIAFIEGEEQVFTTLIECLEAVEADFLQ